MLRLVSGRSRNGIRRYRPTPWPFIFTSYLESIMFQHWEILLVAAVVLLLFGSQKLPQLMRNLGRSATEFKRGMRADGDDAPTSEPREDSNKS
jgi:sec-independent protein translocase protein TatA